MSRLLLWAPFSVTLLFSSFVYIYSEVSAVVVLSLAVAMLVPPQLYDLVTGRISDHRYEDYRALPNAFEYRLTAILMAIKTILLVAFLLYAIWKGKLTVPLAMITGLYGGLSCGTIGMIIAHELVHKRARFDRALAELLLLFMGYAHFAIYHVYGHHIHIATPLDSQTARRGESIYAFIPRSVIGGYRNAWRIQMEQLRKRGLPFFSLRNRMLRYQVEQIALVAIIGLAFGGAALIGFAVFAATSITSLEMINYTQHYGLLRRRLPDGGYERMSKMHSWNFRNYFTNMYALNLGRHSDHHLKAAKNFQTLQHLPDEPTMPFGMFTMFIIALFPPLWFRIADPRLDALSSGEPAPAQATPAEGGYGILAATLLIVLSIVVLAVFNIMFFFPLGLFALAGLAVICILHRRRTALVRTRAGQLR
jgi:alkane 1-monooxygenase